jgi:hypothetical protein
MKHKRQPAVHCTRLFGRLIRKLQEGFRNEGNTLSSKLILDAEEIAWRRWPGQRLYTYVNPRGIRSNNPGACYKAAGWRRCGVTKWNKLVILEKWPNAAGEPQPRKPRT